MGSQFGDFSDDTLNGFAFLDKTISPTYDESLNHANLFNYKDPSQELTSLNHQTPLLSPIPYNSTSSSSSSPGVHSTDDSDSDDVLKYISQMLMEEDMEEKPCMFLDALALQAAEKPFYDALGKKYPPFSNHYQPIDHCLDSLDDDSFGSTSDFSDHNDHEPSIGIKTPPTRTTTTPGVDSAFAGRVWGDLDVGSLTREEANFKRPTKRPPIESFSQPSTLPQWSFGSLGMGIFSDKESMIHFQKGVEEASKFLPKNNSLVIDLENITFPNEITKEEAREMVVKNEKSDENSFDHNSRGSKIHYREEEEEYEQGRSRKQSAIFSTEEADELSDMFDRVLLYPSMSLCHDSRTTMDSSSKKGSPKKGDKSEDVVDLRALLILSSQSIASDDRRTADKLLKQIREHSSPEGDGSQRLAHYFANALEARLSGSGFQIYTALSSKMPTAAKMIKAYQFYLQACPCKNIFIGSVNHLILKASEKASKLHVIDFGILYGFQWPNLIQRLSERPGGPPKLCITGIDLPQSGFRPAERVEATGHRLAKYCERFKVPFEYHAIAKRWETIKPEDLKTGRSDGDDEIVVVNCLFRFKNLLDETIVVDSPRDAVLHLIRRVIKPNIFVHGIVNGSYNAPFFVSRFKEALYHYSTLFDMFDANTSRGEPERLVFEKEFYGREIMNVVACEGTERVERPETYKQWQVRNNRAGFRQIPSDPKIIEQIRLKVKENYLRDIVVDVDGHWTLWGWKGRITYAISTWVPA